jgi:hypothetical protein
METAYSIDGSASVFPAFGRTSWRISIREEPNPGLFKRFSGRIVLEVVNPLPRYDYWHFRLTGRGRSVAYDAFLQRAEITPTGSALVEFQMIDSGNGSPTEEFELSSEDPAADGYELLVAPQVVSDLGELRKVAVV